MAKRKHDINAGATVCTSTANKWSRQWEGGSGEGQSCMEERKEEEARQVASPRVAVNPGAPRTGGVGGLERTESQRRDGRGLLRNGGGPTKLPTGAAQAGGSPGRWAGRPGTRRARVFCSATAGSTY